MANKRIFISFPEEDSVLRDFIVGQSRNEQCPFEFVDMSIKEALPQSEWKSRCRTKIKGCDGLIAHITKNTKQASGELFEINCALEENVPAIGIYSSSDKYSYPIYLPNQLSGKAMEWNWNNIHNWIKKL